MCDAYDVVDVGFEYVRDVFGLDVWDGHAFVGDVGVVD